MSLSTINTMTDNIFGCLDYRRAKLADPHRLSAEARLHERGCEACRRFAQRIDAFEEQAAEALNVPIPEGLSDRIILRARRRNKPVLQYFALAASLVLGLMVTLHFVRTEPDPGLNNLAIAAVEHANDEAGERLIHKSEDPSRFGPILASFGGELQAPVGEVKYIHFCPITGHGMGWHIVYDTPKGPVTLLLVPGKRDEPDVQNLRVEGKLVRVQRAGMGFYALIADSMDGLESADHDLKSKVRWQL